MFLFHLHKYQQITYIILVTKLSYTSEITIIWNNDTGFPLDWLDHKSTRIGIFEGFLLKQIKQLKIFENLKKRDTQCLYVSNGSGSYLRYPGCHTSLNDPGYKVGVTHQGRIFGKYGCVGMCE